MIYDYKNIILDIINNKDNNIGTISIFSFLYFKKIKINDVNTADNKHS